MKLSIYSFLILAIFAFASCEKGELNKDGKEKEKEACFELVYPVTYTMPDDTTISGDDEKTAWTAIKVWYEANPDSEEKPALQYPVDILF